MTTTRWLCCALAVHAVMFVQHGRASPQGIPCGYEIAAVIQAPDCPFTGANPTSAFGISPSGRYICGVHGQCDEYGEAWVYDMQTGVMSTIPRPTGVLGATASDVNDNGIVVGVASVLNNAYEGFVYDTGSGLWTRLLAPAGGSCQIGAINESNIVVGARSIGQQENPTTAFVWSAASGFTDLGLLNEQGTAAIDVNDAGWVAVSNGLAVPGAFAYLWHPRSEQVINIGPAPECISSDAGKMNNATDMLVGGIITQHPIAFAAFLRRFDGHFVQLHPMPGAWSSGIVSITDAAVVAGHGNFSQPSGYRRACIWRNGQPIDLNTLVQAGSLDGYLASARICQSEVIAANAFNGDNERVTYILAPVWGGAGNTNCDGSVDTDDLINVILAWGPCLGCDADLTRDGLVNALDLLETIMHWGQIGGKS
jgi:uncharacterized membrane protein